MLANAQGLADEAEGLASRSIFLDNAGQTLAADAIIAQSYDISRKIDKKTDFAFDLMTMEKWDTPRYIREGLEWLTTTP
jgi:hypothetical protein